MKLKALLCGKAPDGADWDAARLSRSLASAVPPELGLELEVETASVPGAGEALKASGASNFDLALVSLARDGSPSLKTLASFVLAALPDSSSFKAAASAGASDAVPAGEGFEERLDAELAAFGRRFALTKASFALGAKRELPFLALISHELKSPLAAVEGYLRMMAAREAGDALSAYERMIRRSLLRLDAMRKLIENLTDLARAETGGQTRKLEPLELKPLCEEILAGYADEAGSRGIALGFDAPSGESFLSAPGDLRAIVSNLVSNAVKYNRGGGGVSLSLSKNSSILKIEVKDTGIGMAPEELERLDGEFARIRNSDTKEIPGSGLGLSLVRRIASLYGGSLSIESRRGEGSVFAVELREAPEGLDKKL